MSGTASLLPYSSDAQAVNRNFPVEYQVIFSSNHPELGRSMTRLLSDPTVHSNLEANAATVPWPKGNAPDSTMPAPDMVISGPALKNDTFYLTIFK